jgi:hypothetical protein
MISVNVNAQVGAIFQMVTHKGDPTVPVHDTGKFKNIVLNTGLERMAVGAYISQCNIGTGSSTPVATQTSLDAFLASSISPLSGSNTGGVQTTTAPYYAWQRHTWRFNPGVGTGNISEVGLGWSNSNLWNRALIKDLGGSPVTITKLADEYLDVIVELRVYLPTTISGSFNLKDKLGNTLSSHTVTGKPYLVAPSSSALYTGAIKIGGAQNQLLVYSGSMGATVTSIPTGTQSYSRDFSTTYSNPTATSVKAVFKFELDYGNNIAHKSFYIWIQNCLLHTGCVGIQWELNNTISKTNSQELTYAVTMSWSNYTP